MIAAADIIARLMQEGPELRSVQGAIELAALLAAGTPIVGKPFAHVVPMGLRGLPPEVGTGHFAQQIDVTFSVVLTIPIIADPKGEKALIAADPLVNSIITALSGWGPETAPGVIYMTRSQIVRFEPGLIVYGIDFSITDRLEV